MSKDPVREGEPNPGSPPASPPQLPWPPLPPIPPIQLNTIWDVFKIIIVVTVWYITGNANSAIIAAVDYTKIAANSDSLIGVSMQGASIGLLQGLIMAVQALVIIWASPTMFRYLGPVLIEALRAPLQIIAEFRKAISKPLGSGAPEQTGKELLSQEKD